MRGRATAHGWVECRSMPIRREVEEFARLGPLPPISASAEAIQKHQIALLAIRGPLSAEEAELLLASFGPDDCYGLAWTLVHLIESAAGMGQFDTPGSSANEWWRRLWERRQRKGPVNLDGSESPPASP